MRGERACERAGAPPAWRAARAAAALSCAALLAGPAPAGPTTRPARPPPRTASLLRLDELRFELGFEGAFERRRVRSDVPRRAAGTWRQENRDLRLEEFAALQAAGDALGGRLLRYDLRLEWGLTQEWFTERAPGPDRTHRPDGARLRYDARLELLPAGQLSATARALRQEQRLPRRFLPSLDQTLEEYGATLHWNDPRLPVQLEFVHRDEDYASPLRGAQDDERRREDRFRAEALWQPRPGHALRLEYEYVDLAERFSGSATRFDTQRHRLSADHTLEFGPQRRHRWQTRALLEDEQGLLARDRAELFTDLRLRHRDDLATSVGAGFLRDEYFRVRRDQWQAQAGLEHAIGRLTGNWLVHVLREDVREQQTGRGGTRATEWGAAASYAWQRDTPLGRFSARLGYSFRMLDTAGATRDAIVLAEAVTFRDPLPAWLARPDVRPATILVTDAQRVRVFVRGRDYAVLRSGRHVALVRLPGGRIADGQTVRVSYLYRSSRDFVLRTHRVDLHAQQELPFGLTPYYAGSVQDEQRDGGRAVPWAARRIDRHRVGLRWSRPRYSAALEYEFHDDRIDPYQALHLSGDAELWRDARQSVAARAGISWFDFAGTDTLRARRAQVIDADLTWRHALGARLEAVAQAGYRFEDDTSFGRTQGIDLSCSLDWHIGELTLRCAVEYDVLDLPGAQDETLAVFVQVRRGIPLRLPGAAR